MSDASCTESSMRAGVGRRRTGLLVTAVVVFAPCAGGIAYATIPDPGGVIHACRLKATGTLRVIRRALV
jgi:hypothetical protein